jgi:hypothetical protein
MLYEPIKFFQTDSILNHLSVALCPFFALVNYLAEFFHFLSLQDKRLGFDLKFFQMI